MVVHVFLKKKLKTFLMVFNGSRIFKGFLKSCWKFFLVRFQLV